MAIVVFIEFLSDIFAKEWSLKNKTLLVAIALAGYIVTNIFWLIALKNGAGLARGAVVFSAGSAVLGVLFGLLFYKEALNTTQIVGVILGLIGLVLIFWE